MMNRRGLLTGGGVAMLSLGLIGGRSKPTMAAAEGAWATNFDGNSYLHNDGGIARMPATSDRGTIVFNYKSGPTEPGTVIAIGPSVVVNHCSFLDRVAALSINASQMELWLWGVINQNTCNSQNLVIGTVSNPPFNGQNWNNSIVSWIGSSGIIKMTINGQAYSVAIQNYNGYDVATKFSGPCSVGGYFTGDLADIGVFAGTYVDPVDIADQVYNVESGHARRNASDGSGIISGVKPQIWLSGPKFATNRAAGTWTWPGTYSDTNPTSNFSVVGNITTASSDPFEPGSPF